MKMEIRFGLKFLLLLAPFCGFIAVYFIFDPFMVLHSYKRFDRTHVMLNEAYVGWQNYMVNRDSLKYNSFIMGNSCTMAFKTDDWEKYLDKEDRAVRFFDTGESLGGLYQKLHSLDSVNAPIKNVLVIANKNMIKDVYPADGGGHLYSAKASNMSQIAFQISFLQQFLNPNIAVPYLAYLITGKYSSYMKGVINPGPPIREPFTNNFINPRELEIKQKGEQYWRDHIGEFKKRKNAGKEEKRTIYEQQIKLLRKIKKICNDHHTNLIFIIEPDFSQRKINKYDISILKQILGDSSVWDFSGRNQYTSDIHNYYEHGHFRPSLGRVILKQIYGR